VPHGSLARFPAHDAASRFGANLAKLAGALDIDAGDLLEGIVWEPSEVRQGGFVDGGADRRANLERPFQKVVRTVE
jgi:hypothetical protein